MINLKTENYLLNILNLFAIREKNIWIYGAGTQGVKLEKDFCEIGIITKGFIDKRAAQLVSINGKKITTLKTYVTNYTDNDYILIASRFHDKITTDCKEIGLNESKQFISLGKYCESFSPLELNWFIEKYYYNPYLHLRKFGDIRDSETAIYDYLSSRKGDLILDEGLYLETVVKDCNPKCPIELGSYLGKSTLFITKALLASGNSEINTVDTWGWSEEQINNTKSLKEVNKEYLGKYKSSYCNDFFTKFKNNISFREDYKIRIKHHRMLYQEYFKNNKLKYDFIFVDLFHTYEETVNVFKTVKEFLVTGCTVLFHDYTPAFPGEKKAIDELIESGELVIINDKCPGSLIHLKTPPF